MPGGERAPASTRRARGDRSRRSAPVCRSARSTTATPSSPTGTSPTPIVSASRDFATDSLEDVAAIAAHAPGARVFCRLATNGDGALWGLSNKFGCSAADAVQVLEAARAAGPDTVGPVRARRFPADDGGAWHSAFESLADVLTGPGPARDRPGPCQSRRRSAGARIPRQVRGRPLDPPMDKIFAVIREGMRYLQGGVAATTSTSSWSRDATWSPTTAPSGPMCPG